MIIKEMFAKPIDRNINGVIKAGQDDNENVIQELEEYVVTKELANHFQTVFSAYKQSINGNTDKMGVWISGFFGSGKSHFLKILSYLFANAEVNGKRAIEYFTDDKKITDPMVLADMKLAGSISTDAILFNIDSKGNSSERQTIVNVFLRVFNEMQGFCGSIPHLANLERKLADDGKYEEFKQRIEKIADKPWEEYRNDFYFAQDDIVKVLSDMGCMSEESARNWAEMATNNPNYDIAIEDFAKLVKSYIEKKGKNHHVIFLVDEIGQYIGDDRALMLNLQTVTEDLGRICKGKVWIIVTSQQDIDSVTKVKGNDFSKIQGRFDTRLALSSANVDEVIRKRILEKSEISRQSLSLLYDEKETVIKNLIIFNDGIDKKLFSSRDNFSADYPFVPYQFNLLGDVLTAVRLHSSSGKHLSEGERSMLAMFKESAMRVMNQQPGTLIPFHLFYDTLGKFLDSSHSSVIIKALANEKLNPENKDDCFDVNVLKVLFLIKYVNQIKPNIENITSLMVSNVDEDRLSLKEKVEEALNRLISQMLVQKNGDIYVFLTNEEQEINKAIEQQGQNIDNNEIIVKVSELVFDDLYGESKYRFSKFSGRYQFAFNQYVDNRPHKANQNNELTLKILTSYSDELASDNSEQTLRFTSMQNPKSIFVVLPEDTDYLDELRSALSIENFLRLGAGGSISKYPQIKEAKQIELRERYDRAKQYLKDSLEKADIYLNSDKLTSQTRDIKNRINDAMGKLIEQVYHKLSYIDSPMGESDIRNLLSSDPQTLTLEGMGNSKNQLALDDVLQYIGTNSTRHSKTSLKSLYVRFMKDPYGFVEADVQWLVAKLFKSGEIDFYVNNERITTANKSKEEIIGYITSKKYKETLMLDRKEKASEKQKKTVKDVMKEVFHASAVGEEDELIKAFKDKAGEFKNKLEKLEINYNNQPQYPGKDVVLNGKELMQKALATRFSNEFFALVEKNREDLFDFSEDFEPVEAFFKGDQKKHFDEAVKQTGIYEKSRTFIEDKELESVAEQIQNILNMPKPYREIYKLPELNGKFSELNKAMLDKQLVPILEIVKDEKSRVLEETCLKNCKDEFNSRAEKAFTELEEKAKNCQNVAELQTIKMEADILKIRFINGITDFVTKQEAEKAKQNVAYSSNEGLSTSKTVMEPETSKYPAKSHETMSIKKIVSSRTWQLEKESDVDQYVEALKAKLKGLLKPDTVLNIEF